MKMKWKTLDWKFSCFLPKVFGRSLLPGAGYRKICSCQGCAGGARGAHIFSNLQGRWSNVSHAARELLHSIFCDLFLVTIVGQLVKRPIPQRKVSRHITGWYRFKFWAISAHSNFDETAWRVLAFSSFLSKTAAYIWWQLVLTIFHRTCGWYLEAASIPENTVINLWDGLTENSVNFHQQLSGTSSCSACTLGRLMVVEHWSLDRMLALCPPSNEWVPSGDTRDAGVQLGEEPKGSRPLSSTKEWKYPFL